MNDVDLSVGTVYGNWMLYVRINGETILIPIREDDAAELYALGVPNQE